MAKIDSGPEAKAAWLTEVLQRQFGLTYAARFVETPDPEVEDDEFQVLRDGKETGWTIQCCAIGGGYAVNEHGGEGDGVWMRSHGLFGGLAAAAVRLTKRMSAAA